MTSVGTGSQNTAATAELVGCNGEGLWKDGKWYSCIVKKDNQDGTIKVQWDTKKETSTTCILVSSRFPVENFRLEKDDVEEPNFVPTSIFGPPGEEIGDY